MMMLVCSGGMRGARMGRVALKGLLCRESHSGSAAKCLMSRSHAINVSLSLSPSLPSSSPHSPPLPSPHAHLSGGGVCRGGVPSCGCLGNSDPHPRNALPRQFEVVVIPSMRGYFFPLPFSLSLSAVLCRTACEVEAVVRSQGVVPATVGVLDGQVHVGMYVRRFHFCSW